MWSRSVDQVAATTNTTMQNVDNCQGVREVSEDAPYEVERKQS